MSATAKLKTVTVTVRMTEDQRELLQTCADLEMRSISSMVLWMVSKYAEVNGIAARGSEF